ncbi:MAG: hypothetical protein AAB818_02710, partial [Patescibacteria group bacterium]
FNLGKILSIYENTCCSYGVFNKEFGMGGDMMTAESPMMPSIEPGSQDVKINITINYEIR